MTQNIKETYNNLFDFESRKKHNKGENQLYPIHKKLQFKEEKYIDISDWIIEHLKINEKNFILDAGCGVGYLLTRICTSLNCTGLGISLSEKEIAFAKERSWKQGYEKRILFDQKSFDEKLDARFDLIIAIESIKHSDSIQNTIENLVAHLKPGGQIFILDDFETDNRFSFLKKQVKKYWAVKSFYNFNSVLEKFKALNLQFEVADFTLNVAYTKKRTAAIKLFLTYPILLLTKILPVFNIVSIFFAGFCLERLYKKRALEYKAIIATKQS